jgi:sigma-B regulation protein RsbU (phosphoserine phosphatase)
MSQETDLVAEAGALHQKVQSLSRSVEELSVLNDLARAIGASTDGHEVMKTIVRRSIRAVDAEEGVITLDPLRTLVRTTIDKAGSPPHHMNHQLLDWMRLNKTPFVTNSPRADDRFPKVLWDESVGSLLCVPLMARSELVGTLTVFNKRKGRGFTDEDKRLLTIIASQSAQVLENARLCEEEKQFALMRAEMELAAECQANLLPKVSPQIPGYDVAGSSTPAKMVGGDYFDFIALDGGRWAICLGDVAGKGVPAALLMANLQATIRGQLMASISALECIERANRLLCRSTPDHRFVTFFLGILDPAEHRLEYGNAGHNPPFLLAGGGDVSWLKSGGPVLGVIEDASYEGGTISLAEADLLLTYSDGITEAMNAHNEEFGEENLLDLTTAHRTKPSSNLVETILTTVRNFCGEGLQQDDITLVALKRQSQ